MAKKWTIIKGVFVKLTSDDHIALIGLQYREGAAMEVEIANVDFIAENVFPAGGFNPSSESEPVVWLFIFHQSQGWEGIGELLPDFPCPVF